MRSEVRASPEAEHTVWWLLLCRAVEQRVRAALAARAEPPVPDGVWEALQRLIENAGAAGPASTNDALLVARYRRRLLAARAEPSAAHGYAQRLAISLWERHYKTDAPDWKPLPDLMGVLSQIDNMLTGLQRATPK